MNVVTTWNVRGCATCPFLDKSVSGGRGVCRLEHKRARLDVLAIVEKRTPEWCPLLTSSVTVARVARGSKR